MQTPHSAAGKVSKLSSWQVGVFQTPLCAAGKVSKLSPWQEGVTKHRCMFMLLALWCCTIGNRTSGAAKLRSRVTAVGIDAVAVLVRNLRVASRIKAATAGLMERKVGVQLAVLPLQNRPIPQPLLWGLLLLPSQSAPSECTSGPVPIWLEEQLVPVQPVAQGRLRYWPV